MYRHRNTLMRLGGMFLGTILMMSIVFLPEINLDRYNTAQLIAFCFEMSALMLFSITLWVIPFIDRRTQKEEESE